MRVLAFRKRLLLNKIERRNIHPDNPPKVKNRSVSCRNVLLRQKAWQ